MGPVVCRCDYTTIYTKFRDCGVHTGWFHLFELEYLVRLRPNFVSNQH